MYICTPKGFGEWVDGWVFLLRFYCLLKPPQTITGLFLCINIQLISFQENVNYHICYC